MNTTRTTTEPTTAEILGWFDDAGLTVAAIHHTECGSCSTPAAA